ncbi:hypothetical protein [Clostridium sp.]|uniref:hypothetical protein n=1 Tax=Clostridium sp. TaxID=1506 RepID=UPI003991358E
MKDNSMRFSELVWLLRKRWYIVIVCVIIAVLCTNHFVKNKYVITDVVNVTESPAMQKESRLSQLVNYNSGLNKASSVVDEKVIKAALEDINSNLDPNKVLKNLRILIRPDKKELIFQYTTNDDSNWFNVMRSITYKSMGTISLYTPGLDYKRDGNIVIKQVNSMKQRIAYDVEGGFIGIFLGFGVIFFIESILDFKRK